jgi:hypothetical protein
MKAENNNNKKKKEQDFDIKDSNVWGHWRAVRV